jgi:hypothetical protein
MKLVLATMRRCDSVQNYSSFSAIQILSDTNLYRAYPRTLNPNQRSSSFDITFMTVLFGRTSSYPTMMSTVSPYRLDLYEKPDGI